LPWIPVRREWPDSSWTCVQTIGSGPVGPVSNSANSGVPVQKAFLMQYIRKMISVPAIYHAYAQFD
jgi:hypothetical protein